MQRNSLSLGQFRITPVTDFSIFTGFSCLSPDDADRDLDDFIQNDAERHFIDRIAVTYTLEDVQYPKVPLAFATLQNDAVVITPDALLEVSKYSYSAYPAVKIGRFGVHIDYQSRHQKAGGQLHLGSLFLYGLKKLLLQANRTGCRFITVDARRDKANGVDVTPFYMKNGFTPLACRTKTSKYIPMYFDLCSLE